MFEGNAYSRYMSVFLLTDTVLHFTLLSSNKHSQENEENQIFKLIQTFVNNEDVVNFFEDGNIFNYVHNDD